MVSSEGFCLLGKMRNSSAEKGELMVPAYYSGLILKSSQGWWPETGALRTPSSSLGPAAEPLGDRRVAER